jgi:REP element-mobilizing transposase RayT
MVRCIDKGHSALRRGRVSVPGATYLVTTVVGARTPCFADDRYARVVAGLHGMPGAFLDATVLAWVLMPDHWHGVVALGERFPLSAVMKNFKTRACRELRWACDFRGSLWQAAYHDRYLPGPDAITAAIAYLLANPVRAGLCAHPADYPYAGSIVSP